MVKTHHVMQHNRQKWSYLGYLDLATIHKIDPRSQGKFMFGAVAEIFMKVNWCVVANFFTILKWISTQ